MLAKKIRGRGITRRPIFLSVTLLATLIFGCRLNIESGDQEGDDSLFTKFSQDIDESMFAPKEDVNDIYVNDVLFSLLTDENLYADRPVAAPDNDIDDDDRGDSTKRRYTAKERCVDDLIDSEAFVFQPDRIELAYSIDQAECADETTYAEDDTTQTKYIKNQTDLLVAIRCDEGALGDAETMEKRKEARDWYADFEQCQRASMLLTMASSDSYKTRKPKKITKRLPTKKRKSSKSASQPKKDEFDLVAEDGDEDQDPFGDTVFKSSSRFFYGIDAETGCTLVQGRHSKYVDGDCVQVQHRSSPPYRSYVYRGFDEPDEDEEEEEKNIYSFSSVRLSGVVGEKDESFYAAGSAEYVHNNWKADIAFDNVNKMTIKLRDTGEDKKDPVRVKLEKSTYGIVTGSIAFGDEEAQEFSYDLNDLLAARDLLENTIRVPSSYRFLPRKKTIKEDLGDDDDDDDDDDDYE